MIPFIPPARSKALKMAINQFYKNMIFCAEEKDIEGRRLNSLVRERGKYFSHFSGNIKNLTHAQDFLKRNGNFWKERGINLFLFKNGDMVGLAKGNKLIIRDYNEETDTESFREME